MLRQTNTTNIGMRLMRETMVYRVCLCRLRRHVMLQMLVLVQ